MPDPTVSSHPPPTTDRREPAARVTRTSLSGERAETLVQRALRIALKARDLIFGLGDNLRETNKRVDTLEADKQVRDARVTWWSSNAGWAVKTFVGALIVGAAGLIGGAIYRACSR